jgi:type II secretory pathway pseudopilin PulG
MNLAAFKLSSFDTSRRITKSAYTLVEVMVSMTIMVMVLTGVIAVQAFGTRLFQLTKSKLGASDDARKAIDLLVSEMRGAKIAKIGNGDLGPTNFMECAPGQLQVGNAIQLYATTNTTSFVRYFWNTNSTQLKRSVNGVNTNTVANYITNSVFSAEDAFGNVLTNNKNNRVISMKLQFYQLQYPVVRIGPGNYYDSYRLSTKTTPRVF